MSAFKLIKKKSQLGKCNLNFFKKDLKSNFIIFFNKKIKTCSSCSSQIQEINPEPKPR